MKIKNGFVLREVAGSAVVIAVGEASKSFHGMINLNNTGKDIWQGIQAGKDVEGLVEQMTEKYEVSQEEAEADVRELIQKMRQAGILEE